MRPKAAVRFNPEAAYPSPESAPRLARSASKPVAPPTPSPVERSSGSSTAVSKMLAPADEMDLEDDGPGMEMSGRIDWGSSVCGILHSFDLIPFVIGSIMMRSVDAGRVAWAAKCRPVCGGPGTPCFRLLLATT